MHDLFRVPLGEVAEVLNTSPANAKKLASRARRRLQGLEVLPEAGSDRTPATCGSWMPSSPQHVVESSTDFWH
jgi:hypothetical protein